MVWWRKGDGGWWGTRHCSCVPSPQLLGLVKVSLNQFHLALADADLLPSLLKAEYPMVAMDSYCPITNPLTGSTHGHLGLLLALGSSEQVGGGGSLADHG